MLAVRMILRIMFDPIKEIIHLEISKDEPVCSDNNYSTTFSPF